MVPKWAAYSALGVGTAVLGVAAVSVLWPEQRQLCDGWIDPTAPDRIRELAKPIERMMNLDGFGDYLAGVAWIESRGNQQAGSNSGNAARGWFGMRPKSARVYDIGLSPSALKDGPTAVGLAAWYLHRCIPWAAPGQRIDWLSIRRCWGYPKDTDDVDSTEYRDKLARGLECAGVNPDFMYEKAIRWNYTWPGIDAIMAAVGRPLAVAA